MKLSFMKLSFGVLLSIAAALAFGISLTHRVGVPPASNTMSVSVPQPATGVEAPVPGVSSAEEAEAPASSVAVAESDRKAETQPQDMAALREKVALLEAEVSALQRWRHTQGRAATGVAPERVDAPPEPAQRSCRTS